MFTTMLMITQPLATFSHDNLCVCFGQAIFVSFFLNIEIV